MFFYIVLLSIPSIFTLHPLSKGKNNSLFFIYSYFICLAYLLGLRENIGGDWINYKVYYETIETRFSPISFNLLENDYLFDIINWISIKLSLSFYAVNFINFSIFIFCLGLFLRKFKNPSLVVVIAAPYLIFVAATGYVRQVSAFGLFLISLLFLMKEKYFRFLFFLFLGALFHKTIFIMGVLFPLVVFNFKKLLFLNFNTKKIIFLITFTVFSIFFYFYYLKFKFSFILYYYVGEGKFFDSKGAIYRFLPFFISSFLFILFYKKLNLKNIELKIYFVFAIFVLFMTPFIFTFSSAIDRILLYFYPIQFLILSQLHVIFDDRRNRIFYNFLISLFAFSQLIIWAKFAQYSKHWLNFKNILIENIL